MLLAMKKRKWQVAFSDPNGCDFLSQLPGELIHQIIEYCRDYQTIRALCTTSKKYHEIFKCGSLCRLFCKQVLSCELYTGNRPWSNAECVQFWNALVSTAQPAWIPIFYTGFSCTKVHIKPPEPPRLPCRGCGCQMKSFQLNFEQMPTEMQHKARLNEDVLRIHWCFSCIRKKKDSAVSCELIDSIAEPSTVPWSKGFVDCWLRKMDFPDHLNADFSSLVDANSLQKICWKYHLNSITTPTKLGGFVSCERLSSNPPRCSECKERMQFLFQTNVDCLYRNFVIYQCTKHRVKFCVTLRIEV